MEIKRIWTKAGFDPFNEINWVKRKSNLAHDIIAPDFWSQTAVDILSQKYMRVCSEDGRKKETDARQVFKRMALAWKNWARKTGLIKSKKSADIFYDEICYMLAMQIAAPNSPQWFNTGLFEAYGLKGRPQGHWYVDHKTGEVKPSRHAFTRPQPHACFIQSVEDDLTSDGGIMRLWEKEARLFKFGSGSGTNFSNIRAKGENLTGGGTSAGVMSYLKIGDAAAGAIKSGGTTRRAAKMVILDIDHPEIMDFIQWKAKEELKVAALVAGSYQMEKYRLDSKELSWEKMQSLAMERGIPLGHARNLYLSRQSGVEFVGAKMNPLNTDWEGDAYQTVSGQNANLSVRVPDRFLKLLEMNPEALWTLKFRSEVKKTSKPAHDIWQTLCHSAWQAADPGILFQSNIDRWHTCPEDGPIEASNPCSEYLFLSDTACNLASINLIKFLNRDQKGFDFKKFKETARLWTIVLEISVSMAQYPSKEIAEKSVKFRTLGLGFSNLGALIMRLGLAYDSDEARKVAGMITAFLSGAAWLTSFEMAKVLGACSGFRKNKDHFKRVLKNHCKLARGKKVGRDTFYGIPLEASQLWTDDYEDLKKLWQEVELEIEKRGPRNAQVTVIAPTGTIGLLMDCDTTGIEPEFSLVKQKKLAGGGFLEIVNQSVPIALKNLGYRQDRIEVLTKHLLRSGHFEGHDFLKKEHLSLFDCATKPMDGERSITPLGHVKMMAHVQPFICGGISKTVNLPENATPETVSDIYLEAWKLGLKSIALYREGSKLSQPLMTSHEIKAQCPSCGLKQLIPAGTCHRCLNCGETTGCS